MTNNTNNQKFDTTRSSPRAAAAIDVEVEVAGAKKRVQLVSRDIGAGGMFLRTTDPAPLWKRVSLSFELPDGKFEVAGEVVRSVSKTDSETSGHPPGMAIAFDDVSRSKRKELIALVLDLCARRPEKPSSEPKEAQKQESPQGTEEEPDKKVEEEPQEAPERDSTDDLLSELDDLLDSVESEIEKDDEPTDSQDDDSIDLPSLDMEESVVSDESEAGLETSLRINLDDYRKSLKGDTYYDLLGVTFEAGPGEIEKSYQRLLEELKPPAPPDSLPPDLLQELSSVLGKIRKAFAILSKPDRKRAYDFLIDNQIE
jgi:hypothetical protein